MPSPLPQDIGISLPVIKAAIIVLECPGSRPCNTPNRIALGMPQVANIHAKPEDLPAVIEKALADIDGPVQPYRSTR